MTRLFKRISALVPAALLGLSLVPATASAAATTRVDCTVTNVAYDTNRLVLQCTAVSGQQSVFYALSGNASCVSQNSDTLKIWQSLSTSAYLSGKRLNIVYEPSSSACGINAVYQLVLHD